MTDTGRIRLIVGKPAGAAPQATDRRVARTIEALVKAFVSLMFERNYRTISVADITVRANVGRSTFYDHFHNKDEMLLASMGWMFAILADAVDPGCPRDPIDGLAAHFWDNRRLARVVLAPPIEAKLRRGLAAVIEERLSGPIGDPVLRRIAAVRIAAGQLGLLEAWTKGELSAGADQIADAMLMVARHQDEGIRQGR